MKLKITFGSFKGLIVAENITSEVNLTATAAILGQSPPSMFCLTVIKLILYQIIYGSVSFTSLLLLFFFSLNLMTILMKCNRSLTIWSIFAAEVQFSIIKKKVKTS